MFSLATTILSHPRLPSPAVIAPGYLASCSGIFGMLLSEDAADKVVMETIQWPSNRKWATTDREKRVRALFGVSSKMIAIIWNKIWESLSQKEIHSLKKENVKFKYLLYALVFLKVYGTEEIHCSILDWPSAKTFREWSWYFVEKIAGLKRRTIKLRNRFGGFKIGDEVRTNCFISVDCTDCPIFEPWPFDTKWFSHKTNGPALKYEVAVCIKTGFIVWINGPFKASKSDPVIFKEGLSTKLAVDEAVEADGVYKISDGPGARQIKAPDVGWDSKERKAKSCARSRNERVNGKLKVFNVLANHFHHMKPRDTMMEKHKRCFHAVAVITQLKMENGELIQDFNYDDYDVNYF